MVDSSPGRTEPAELWKPGPQARRAAEAYGRDVWQPRPLLGVVDAELLETRVQVSGETRRPARLVGEAEHADAAGLAVAIGLEDDWTLDRSCGGAQRLGDGLQLSGRTAAQEGEREMQMLTRDEPSAGGELGLLPAAEEIEDLARQRERAEEPEAFTASDGTSVAHTSSSRLCDKSRRTR